MDPTDPLSLPSAETVGFETSPLSPSHTYMNKKNIFIIGASIGVTSLVLVTIAVVSSWNRDLAAEAATALQISDDYLQQAHDLYCEDFLRQKAACFAKERGACNLYEEAAMTFEDVFETTANEGCEPTIEHEDGTTEIRETCAINPDTGDCDTDPGQKWDTIAPLSNDKGMDPLFFGDEE